MQDITEQEPTTPRQSHSNNNEKPGQNQPPYSPIPHSLDYDKIADFAYFPDDEEENSQFRLDFGPSVPTTNTEHRQQREQRVRKAHNPSEARTKTFKAFDDELAEVKELEQPHALRGEDGTDLGDLHHYAPLTMGILALIYRSKFLNELSALDTSRDPELFISEIKILVNSATNNGCKVDKDVHSVTTKLLWHELSEHPQSDNASRVQRLELAYRKALVEHHTQKTMREFVGKLMFGDDQGMRQKIASGLSLSDPLLLQRFNDHFKDPRKRDIVAILCNQTYLIQSGNFGYNYAELKFKPPTSEREQYVFIPQSIPNYVYLQLNWYAPIYEDVQTMENATGEKQTVPNYRVKNKGVVRIRWKISLRDFKDENVFFDQLKKTTIKLEDAYQEIYDRKYRLASRNILLKSLYHNICDDKDRRSNEEEAKNSLLDEFPLFDTWVATEQKLWKYLAELEQNALSNDTPEQQSAHKAQQLWILAYFNQNIARYLMIDCGHRHRYMFQIALLVQMVKEPRCLKFLDELKKRHATDHTLVSACEHFKQAIEYCRSSDVAQLRHALNDPVTRHFRQHFVLAALQNVTSKEQALLYLRDEVISKSLDHDTLQRLILVAGAPEEEIVRIDQPSMWQRMIEWQNANTKAEEGVYNPSTEALKSTSLMLVWQTLFERGMSDFIDLYQGETYDRSDMEKLRSFLQRLAHNQHHREYIGKLCQPLSRHQKASQLLKDTLQYLSSIKENSALLSAEARAPLIDKVRRNDLALSVALHTLDGSNVGHVRLIRGILSDKNCRATIDLATIHYFEQVARNELANALNNDRQLRARYQSWKSNQPSIFNEQDRSEHLQANPELWNSIYRKHQGLDSFWTYTGFSKDYRKSLSANTLRALLLSKNNASKHARVVFSDQSLMLKVASLDRKDRMLIADNLGFDVSDLRKSELESLFRGFFAPGYTALKRIFVHRWIDRNFDQSTFNRIFSKKHDLPEIHFAREYYLERLLSEPQANRARLISFMYQDKIHEQTHVLHDFLRSKDQLKLRLLFIKNLLDNPTHIARLMNPDLIINKAYDAFRNFAQDCFMDVLLEIQKTRSTQLLGVTNEQLQNLFSLLTPDAQCTVCISDRIVPVLYDVLMCHDDATHIFAKMATADAVDLFMNKLEPAQLRQLYVKLGHLRINYLQNNPKKTDAVDQKIHNAISLKFQLLQKELEALMSYLGVNSARIHRILDWLKYHDANAKKGFLSADEQEIQKKDLMTKIESTLGKLSNHKENFKKAISEAKKTSISQSDINKLSEAMMEDLLEVQKAGPRAPRIGNAKVVEKFVEKLEKMLVSRVNVLNMPVVNAQHASDSSVQTVVVFKIAAQLSVLNQGKSDLLGGQTVALKESNQDALIAYGHLFDWTQCSKLQRYPGTVALIDDYEAQPEVDNENEVEAWVNLKKKIKNLNDPMLPNLDTGSMIAFLKEKHVGRLLSDYMLHDLKLLTRFLSSPNLTAGHLFDFVKNYHDDYKPKMVESLLAYAMASPTLLTLLTDDCSEQLLRMMANTPNVNMFLWFDFIAILPRELKYSESIWTGLYQQFLLQSNLVCNPHNLKLLQQHFWNASLKEGIDEVNHFDHWFFAQYVQGHFSEQDNAIVQPSILQMIQNGYFNGNDFVKALQNEQTKPYGIKFVDLISDKNDPMQQKILHDVLTRKYNSADVTHVYKLLQIAREKAVCQKVVDKIYSRPLIDFLLQNSNVEQLGMLLENIKSENDPVWEILAEHFLENEELRKRVLCSDNLWERLFDCTQRCAEMVWLDNNLLRNVVFTPEKLKRFIHFANNDQLVDMLTRIKLELNSKYSNYVNIKDKVEDDDYYENVYRFTLSNEKLVDRLLYGETSREKLSDVLRMLVEFHATDKRKFPASEWVENSVIHNKLANFMFNQTQPASFTRRYLDAINASDFEQLFDWLDLMLRLYSKRNNFIQADQNAQRFFSAFMRPGGNVENKIRYPEIIDRLLVQCNAVQLFKFMSYDLGSVILTRVVYHCCDNPRANPALSIRLKTFLAQKRVGDESASEKIKLLISHKLVDWNKKLVSLFDWNEYNTALSEVGHRMDNLPLDNYVHQCLSIITTNQNDFVMDMKKRESIDSLRAFIRTVRFYRGESSINPTEFCFKNGSDNVSLPKNYEHCFRDLYIHLLIKDPKFLKEQLGNYVLHIVQQTRPSYRFVLRGGGELLRFEQHALNTAIHELGQEFWDVCFEVHRADLIAQLPPQRTDPSENSFIFEVMKFLVKFENCDYAMKYLKPRMYLGYSEQGGVKQLVPLRKDGIKISKTAVISQLYDAAKKAQDERHRLDPGHEKSFDELARENLSPPSTRAWINTHLSKGQENSTFLTAPPDRVTTHSVQPTDLSRHDRDVSSHGKSARQNDEAVANLSINN